MEDQLNQMTEQEMAQAQQQMMQDIATEAGAVYEEDEQGNKTGVWLPVDSFHNMLELVSEAAMKMSMLEAMFAQEGEEDEECDEDDDCCDDECAEDCDEECCEEIDEDEEDEE